MNFRVNVDCVAFGYIDTRLTQRFEGSPATIDIKGSRYKVGLDTRVLDALTPTIPLGRPGTPEEAAGSAYLFCIPESDYVNGQVLICDGGPRICDTFGAVAARRRAGRLGAKALCRDSKCPWDRACA